MRKTRNIRLTYLPRVLGITLAILGAGLTLRHAASQLTVAASPASSAVHFVDVTRQAGIRFVHNTGAFGKKYLPETMGAGCAFIDYDNDGKPDILQIGRAHV